MQERNGNLSLVAQCSFQQLTISGTDSRHPTIKLAFGLGRCLLRHRHLGLLRSRNPLRPCPGRDAFFCSAHHRRLHSSVAKYIEISWRNPEGGGVVTITTKAFGPMWGCLG